MAPCLSLLVLVWLDLESLHPQASAGGGGEAGDPLSQPPGTLLIWALDVLPPEKPFSLGQTKRIGHSNFKV